MGILGTLVKRTALAAVFAVVIIAVTSPVVAMADQRGEEALQFAAGQLSEQSSTRPTVYSGSRTYTYDGSPHTPYVSSPGNSIYYGGSGEYDSTITFLMLRIMEHPEKWPPESLKVAPTITDVGTLQANYFVTATTPPTEDDKLSLLQTIAYLNSAETAQKYPEWSPSKCSVVVGSASVTIVPKSISSCTVTLSSSEQKYTGSPIVPAVTVKDGTRTLVEGTDYTVSCSNNTNVGTASMTIDGLNNYSDSKTVNFRIVPIAYSDLNYSFVNNYDGFDDYPGFKYKYPYSIPLERFELMFGSKRAEQYWLEEDEWGGNCFGMATTSSMLNDASTGLKMADFNSNAKRLHDLGVKDYNSAIGMNMQVFVEAMQISQYNDIYSEVFEDYSDEQTVLDYVTEQTGVGVPVVVAVWSPYYDGGHALLAYKVEKKSGSAVVRVYDCNHPEDSNRSIRFALNGAGEVTGWSYDLGWETYTNGFIACYPSSLYKSVWANRGKQRSGTTNALVVNSKEFNVYDSNGKLIAEVKNGILQNPSDMVSQQHIVGIRKGDTKKDKNVILTLKNGLCKVENKDPRLAKLSASYSDQEQLVTVETEASAVYLEANDITGSNAVQIADSSGKSYVVTIGSTLKSAKGNESVTVRGKSSGPGAKVSVKDGKLVTENTEGAKVDVDSKTQGKKVSLASAEVAVASGTWTGKALVPNPTVKLGGKTLKLGTDYKIVRYENNQNAGTASVLIAGIGAYTGTAKGTFTINKARNSLTVKAKALKAKKGKKTVVKKKKAFKVTGAQGKVTFKKLKGNKKIVVSKSGKVAVKKGLKPGKYTVKVKVTAKGNANYLPVAKKVKLKVVVK